MTLQILPNPGPWPTPTPDPIQQPVVTPRDDLNDSAKDAKETQMQVAADGAPLRIVYGKTRVGAQLADAIINADGNMVFLLVWCQGEIEGVLDYTVSGEWVEEGSFQYVVPPIDTTKGDGTPITQPVIGQWVPDGKFAYVKHYTGTQDQAVDPQLVAAFAAQTPPVTFTDRMPGVAYSVFVLAPNVLQGFPTFVATIMGSKVWAYGQNLVPYSYDSTRYARLNGVDASYKWDKEAVVPHATKVRIISTASTPSIGKTIDVGSSIATRTFSASVRVRGVDATIGMGFFLRIQGTGGVDPHLSYVGTIPDSDYRVWTVSHTFGSGTQVTGIEFDIVFNILFVGDGPPQRTYAVGDTIHVDEWQCNEGNINGYTYTSDVATPALAWSDNPAYCLADFITSTTYGMGRGVEPLSVQRTAEFCNTMIGTVERQRTINLVLETVQQCQQWVDTLRTYASCWVMTDNTGLLKLVPDRAAPQGGYDSDDYAVDGYDTDNYGAITFDHASGNIKSISTIKKRGVRDVPTVMTITYTNTSAIPTKTAYSDGTVTVMHPGVALGTTPRRESQVSLPGITRYSQAYREAVERLNKLMLNDLSMTLGVFDEGLQLEVGDVVTVTHPIGFDAKPLRIMGISGEYGRHELQLVEYDPAVYSAEVQTEPTWPDTNLPNPLKPPTLTDITLVEEAYQLQNGTYSTRFKAAWTPAAYAYLAHYRCELWDGVPDNSVRVFSATTYDPAITTSALQEGVDYTFRVAAATSAGVLGDWASANATAIGKHLPPGNVPSITGFEAGGTVYLSWTAAADVDVWRYEIRYSDTSGTWDSATVIDVVDALRLQVATLAVGTWRIFVKAIDSVDQYSATAAYCDVVVTSDAAAFRVDSKNHATYYMEGMRAYVLLRGAAAKVYFVTEDDVAFATKFSSAMSTYTNPLVTYHASQTSYFKGGAKNTSNATDIDFGQVLSGQVTGIAEIQVLSGTADTYLGIGSTSGIDTWLTGLSHRTSLRFGAVKASASGTSTLLLEWPLGVAVDVIPRIEQGHGTSTSSSGSPTKITLANYYVATKKITVTPQGSTARTATFDNVIVNSTPCSFDVFVFDSAGNPIVSDFQWEYQGF